MIGLRPYGAVLTAMILSCVCQLNGAQSMHLTGWQLKPAVDPASMPDDSDWLTLPINMEDPHNNSAYDWRNLPSGNDGDITWSKINRGRTHNLWWRCNFNLDSVDKSNRVMIDFAQIQGDAIVFCNGQRVGELLRPGGSIELTQHVRYGKPNVMLVFNTRDYTGISRNFEQDLLRYYARERRIKVPINEWGLGITGPVTLSIIPTPAGITDLFAKCSWDDKTLAIDVQTDATKALNQAIFSATIRDADGKVALQFDSQPQSIKQGQQTHTLTANWADPIGWQIDDPYLYTMQVSLKQNNQTLHTTVPQSFGFRDLKVVGKEIQINGVKTRLRTSSFVSGKTVPDLAFFTMMGYNFFYSQPNPTSWWKNWSETRLYTQEFLEYADTHGIGLSMPIPGVDHLRNDLLDNEPLKKAYLKEQQDFVRRYRGHPSVLFWTVGMNTMNPRDAIHPVPLGQRQNYTHPMAAVIKLASESAKSVDPNTLVYSHADGNQGDLATSNLYTNFAPLQDRIDWPMYYAKDGDMPFCAVEFGQPITANFIKGKQVYFAEFMARELGDIVYKQETVEALSKIGDVINSPWDSNKYIPLYKDTYWDFQSLFMDQTNRAWRTYDVTATGYYWDFSVGFGEPPSYDPRRESLWTKYSRHIKEIPTEVPNWVNKNFYLHRRGLQPLITYLAGHPTHTDKTHAYYQGNQITKQIAYVWDGPGSTELTTDWQVTDSDGKVLKQGTDKVQLKTGDIQLHPISFTAPQVSKRSVLTLSMSAKQDGKEIANDSLSVEIYPAFDEQPVKHKVAIYDPAGKSRKWVSQFVPDLSDWQVGQKNDGVKLLVIGREALNNFKTLPFTAADIRNGLDVLMLEQLPVEWEKMGLKCLEVGTRVLEPRLVNDPIIKGMTMTDLSYWQGHADLLPENKPARSYDLRRAARVNNKHVVAPVLFEIPQRVGFTALMAGEFDMNYTPLLRYRDGKGQIMFCSLSFNDRVGQDPVPTQIAHALLNDVSDTSTRPTHWLGIDKAIASLGFAMSEPQAKGLMIVDGKDTHVSAQELRSYAAGGGNVLVFQANDALTSALGYITKPMTLRKAALSDTLTQMGVGPNLLRWREALQINGFADKGQPNGAQVLASGLILQQKIDAGKIVIAQFTPDMLGSDEPYHTQVANQRLRQLASLLMTAMGATPAAQQSQLLNTIEDGAQYNRLKHWHILGPIKAQGTGVKALEPAYPGQDAAVAGDTNPNFTYQQANGANLDFRKTVMAKDNGYVDIASVVNHVDGYVAYATREIESDTARAAILKIGVDYWADVYLNGKHVYRVINRSGPPKDGSMSVKLNLNKGKNVITLKIVSGSRGFGFWASLSEGDIHELEQQQQDQSENVRLYTPMPQPFDPYEYHYW